MTATTVGVLGQVACERAYASGMSATIAQIGELVGMAMPKITLSAAVI